MIKVTRIRLSPPCRRVARDLARAGAFLSAAMLVFGVAVGNDRPATAAGVDSGIAQINIPGTANPLNAGGSATEFAMVPPQGASCPGGASGTPSYRWTTFMVADSVDVSNLTYTTDGPVAVGSEFVSPMWDHAGGSQVTNRNPASAPAGLINDIPTFSFAVFTPGDVPAGDYKIGFACTTGVPAETVSFWTARITVVADASDSPAQFTWTLAAPPRPSITGLTASPISGPGVHLGWAAPAGDAPTDYTVAVTPTVAGAPFAAPAGSTTFDITGLVADTAYSLTVTANYATAPLAGPPAIISFTFVTTTTTVAPTTTVIGTTTTVVGTTTTAGPTTTTPEATSTSMSTTTIAGVSSATSTTRPGSAPTPIQAAPQSPSTGTLAATGSSPYPIVIWGILLLVFGRIAILLGRPLKVRLHQNR